LLTPQAFGWLSVADREPPTVSPSRHRSCRSRD
jgi:hypothetical protein